MSIAYLKGDPGFIPKIASHMFGECGYLREGATFERYVNLLGNQLQREL
jgi:hypothetical protein